MPPAEFQNWLEFTDFSDSHHELINIAKHVLHSWLYSDYEVPSDIILKAQVNYGVSLDELKPNTKLVELVKSCEKHHYTDEFYSSMTECSVGWFEHFFFSNLCQYCSKFNNDFEHVIWDLKWMLSDIPFCWYRFKEMSKTFDRWQETRREQWAHSKDFDS